MQKYAHRAACRRRSTGLQAAAGPARRSTAQHGHGTARRGKGKGGIRTAGWSDCGACAKQAGGSGDATTTHLALFDECCPLGHRQAAQLCRRKEHSCSRQQKGTLLLPVQGGLLRVIGAQLLDVGDAVHQRQPNHLCIGSASIERVVVGKLGLFVHPETVCHACRGRQVWVTAAGRRAAGAPRQSSCGHALAGSAGQRTAAWAPGRAAAGTH